MAIYSEKSNSFDCHFYNYTPETRLYIKPVVWTNDAFNRLWSSPILWDILDKKHNGFLLNNNYLITDEKKLTNMSSNRFLTLMIATRFYSIYKDSEAEIQYIFFSKLAVKSLLEFWGCDLSEDVVGVVTLYKNIYIFSEINESVTLLITKDPTKWNKSFGLDLNSNYIKMYGDILKNKATRYIKLCLMYHLQYKLFGSDNSYWEDEKENDKIIDYIRKNYSVLNDEEKDICHIILPDEYKFVKNTPYSKQISDLLVTEEVVSVYNLIKSSNLITLVSGLTLEKYQTQMLETMYTHFMGRSYLALSEDKGLLYKSSVVLLFINKAFSAERAEHVSALWLYHNLYRMLSVYDGEVKSMAYLLLAYVVRTNEKYFVPIINEIKSIKIKSKTIFKWDKSWKLLTDISCINELCYFWLNQTEDKVYCQAALLLGDSNISSLKILKESNLRCGKDFDEERQRYAELLFEHIDSSIRNDPYSGY